MKSIRRPLIVAGASIVALACAMMLIAAGMFTMAQQPPPLMDWIGRISFWGFIPTGLVGAVVLIVGLLMKRTS